LGAGGPRRLWLGWGIGVAVTIAGAALSWRKDLPMDACIVCLFGLAVILASLYARLRRG
jgi:ABC-type Mn2+/Zn2+ transport system permease subunit